MIELYTDKPEYFEVFHWDGSLTGYEKLIKFCPYAELRWEINEGVWEVEVGPLERLKGDGYVLKTRAGSYFAYTKELLDSNYVYVGQVNH